jgi:hypothetical protein
MKRLLHIAFFLCAWTSLRPDADACSLMKVADLPLIELGNHYAVMANVAGQPRPMIVDTGSQTTLISAKAADELKLKDDPNAALPRPVLGVGQTSAVLYLNVIPPVLGFGDLVFHDRSTVVASLDFGPTPEADAVGILGDDILSAYDVEFDFLGDRLTLYDEFDCSDAFLPWTGRAYFTLPFDHRNAKISIDIFLNGERTPAIVDTGNNASFVSRMTPALWGALAHEMKKTRLKSVSPFNGGTSLPNQRYQFEEIRIGDDVYENEYMKIIQVQLPGVGANLGLDYWKQRKLWISYPNGLLFVSGMNASPTLAYSVKANASSATKIDAQK